MLHCFRFLLCLILTPCLTAQAKGELTWPIALGQQEAWKALPQTNGVQGDVPPASLPTWARALAKDLPYTTAALIELEYVYRITPMVSPSSEQVMEGNELACLARFAVARFHRSKYGLDCAIKDATRWQLTNLLPGSLDGEPSLTSPLHQEVYRFAQQLAERGSSIQDDAFATLHEKLGDEAMVGLVLRIAHACFQDRLLLALGIADVADATPDPLEVRFVDSTANGANTPSRERRDPPALLESVLRGEVVDVLVDAQRDRKLTWKDANVEEMRHKLTLQRQRPPRIKVPEWDWVSQRIPADLYKRPLRIRWSRVVVGYQPKLGPAWIKCLRVFEQEAHQNRVFEESVFWVVTRSLRCFYCMGHCEMLMEVGGLGVTEIERRTSRLEQGDWSVFSREEQVAFAFAKKLTERPWDITQSDRDGLKETLGDERAMDLIWWSSRCQFMTKVSDAFQLQLETENVFAN